MPSSNASAPVATALVCAAALGTAAWAGGRAIASSQKSKTKGAANVFGVLPPGAFDVAIVGAGPAGSTAAYYLAKGGARVALLEKEKFPRGKNCHGALAAPACAILKDMGVLADLHGTVLAVATSENAPARGLHVERRELDRALADAAAAAGADLRRGFEASGLASSFDADAGMWTVRSTRSSFVGGGGGGGRGSGSGGGATRSGSGTGEAVATGNEGGSIAARLLILADGASSTVGAELGFVVAAAAAGGGGRGSVAVVVPSPSSEKVAPPPAPKQRVASSGVPRSYGDHWMIVGEAAGHAEARPAEEAREGGNGDGEGQGEVYHGIHTAMRGGELAAAAALAMRARGDFSAPATGAYERAWRREFGASVADAWPRAARGAARGAAEGCSDLVEALSGGLGRLGGRLAASAAALASSLPAAAPPPLPSLSLLPPIEALLRERAGSAAAAARTALESAAASAVAAARFGASVRTRWSGDGGGGGGTSSQEEASPAGAGAETATASVEVSLSPSGKGKGGGASSLGAALLAAAGAPAAEGGAEGGAVAAA